MSEHAHVRIRIVGIRFTFFKHPLQCWLSGCARLRLKYMMDCGRGIARGYFGFLVCLYAPGALFVCTLAEWIQFSCFVTVTLAEIARYT